MSYTNIEKLGKPSILEDYDKLSPRHQRIVAWTIKEYLDIEEKSNERIPTEIWTVDTPMGEPIHKFVDSPITHNIMRRRLDNLNVIDFDYGIRFSDDSYMPFFCEGDTALFCDFYDGPDTGDMCLVKSKICNNWWLAFKEENGFFELNGSFLDNGEGILVVGILVNIESK